VNIEFAKFLDGKIRFWQSWFSCW